MNLNYLAAFGIPAFFLFLLLEYVLVGQRKKEIFKYESSIANLGIGIAERLLNLFISASFIQVFYYIYENYAVFHIPNHWYVWIFLILVTDLIWYWYHRLGHEINLLWGAHIVHHQSEEFNYTVSARITTFQALVRNIFWCVIPFLGFHPAMVVTILVIHGTYSFFTHTQLIGKIGWFEKILISPSLHGIHHASNEKYLNKNYGDVFVFWDKLFGTFQQEEEKPVYGLTHPLKSYSFLWQHFHYYLEMWVAFKAAEGFKAKMGIIFGNPENLDQNIRPQLEQRFLSHKRQANAGTRFKNYVNIQIFFCVVLLCLITAFYPDFSTLDKIFTTIIILITLINCGALLEQRRWIYYLEYVRLLLLSGYLSIVFDNTGFMVAAILFFIVLNLFSPMQKWYLKVVYNSDNS